jgi:alpha-mannosidase
MGKQTGNDGSRFVRVYNTQAGARNGWVAASLEQMPIGNTIAMRDGMGNKVPSQIISSNGNLQLLFKASVPSMGFNTYSMEVGGAPATSSTGISSRKDGSYVLETDLYRLTIDAERGGRLRSFIAKKMGNREFVDLKNARSFNELRGYFFEDSSYFSSTDKPATIIIRDNGPYFFRIEIHGFIKNHPFVQTISTAQGEALVDFQTKIDWVGSPAIGDPYKQNGAYKNEEYRKAFYVDSNKLLTLFPLNLENQKVFKNAPFDVTQSSLSNTFFQTWDSIKNNVLLNWVDVVDGQGKYGLAAFSDHTTGYVHGSNFPVGIITQYSGAGLWGRRYSLTGPTEFRYALLPHTGKWDAAGVWEANVCWNNPMITTTFQAKQKPREIKSSLIAFSGKGYEVTAMMMDGNDLIVRLYNASGTSAKQRMSFAGQADSVSTEELDGQTKAILATATTGKGVSISVAMPRFGIRTIRLKNFKSLL